VNENISILISNVRYYPFSRGKRKAAVADLKKHILTSAEEIPVTPELLAKINKYFSEDDIAAVLPKINSENSNHVSYPRIYEAICPLHVAIDAGDVKKFDRLLKRKDARALLADVKLPPITYLERLINTYKEDKSIFKSPFRWFRNWQYEKMLASAKREMPVENAQPVVVGSSLKKVVRSTSCRDLSQLETPLNTVEQAAPLAKETQRKKTPPLLRKRKEPVYEKYTEEQFLQDLIDNKFRAALSQAKCGYHGLDAETVSVINKRELKLTPDTAREALEIIDGYVGIHVKGIPALRSYCEQFLSKSFNLI
jgi:hypothetical protein